jgi:UDP-galactopyranose mutase
MSKFSKNIDFDVLIVGCGLTGVVLAEQFASKLNKRVLIIEKRDHIGGNCYDYVDPDTNILMNKYGAHLFHTNEERVWNYVNTFDKWVRWDHSVVGMVENKLVSIPVNINTVNQLCGQSIKSEAEMNDWLAETQVEYDVIENSEQMGKSRVGEILYNKIFRDYTFKQWNKYPEELDASVLARIPIRNNFDNRYFDDRFQALPEKGYTHFISKILDHSNINVLVNTDYFEFVKENPLSGFKHVIYTGPIDAFYSASGLEKLEYRSIDFSIEKFKEMNYYQPASVVNYPETNVPFTRIVEYKHFLNQQSPDTLIVKEVTRDSGEPFYPVPNKQNMDLYQKYKEMAANEKNIHFVGRLANYKYFNMDGAILNALQYFDENFMTHTCN